MRIHEPYVAAMVGKLQTRRVTPNMLTLATVPPAVLGGICAAYGWFIPAALLFVLSGVLDLLDGALARANDQRSRFGALLDSSLDRVADACIPVGLVVFYAPHGAVAALPALALVAGFWISYIRARAQSLDLHLPRLWMRREDRFAALVIALLLTPFVWTDTTLPAPLIALVMGGIASLGFIAGGAALVQAARLAGHAPPPPSQ
ncbi:MAG: CDP-alcohol phosphatidyltransferase family protein [Roseovarius sp.]